MCFTKPIFTSLSPNTGKDDILLSLKLIFQPWKWKKGNGIKEIEKEFKDYLGVNNVFTFNSGRSSLLAILDALGMGEGDEVLLQGFTCNAAVNPILKLGAKPVFVDIDDTLNIDPVVLKKKLTSRSKAVIVQHTFGWPAKMEEILEITKENNLFLIEDCAHSLGAEWRGRLCGTLGDAAFFSLGRDKVISSVFGGLAIVNNAKLVDKIKSFQEKIEYPSSFWIFQQLLHPFVTNYIVMPAYALSAIMGKFLLSGLHLFSILSKAVYKKEKEGELVEQFPKKLPNALAILGLNQFRKLERFNEHRREIAGFYQKNIQKEYFVTPFDKPSTKAMVLGKEKVIVEPVFMRYPILTTDNTDYILKQARKRKIFLDDGWRKSPIVPPDTDLGKMNYQSGSCPRAERIAESIINLPTHINISQKEAQKIIDLINGK